MRLRHIREFLERLGQRDVQAFLPLADPFEKELERHRRLPAAGVALHDE